jgi:hypothetical protein
VKTCSYCGAEYPDEAVECMMDHSQLTYFFRVWKVRWCPVAGMEMV